MAPVQPYSRRRKRSGWLWMALFTIPVLALGTVATLWALGLPPFNVEQPLGPHVAIPVNARPIPAYQSVTREDMFDSKTGQLAYLRLKPSQVRNVSVVWIDENGEEQTSGIADVVEQDGGMIVVTADGAKVSMGRVKSVGGALVQVSSVLGRVVKSDKKPMYGFTEDSFMPKGTRQGVTAGIPPGKRSLTLRADSLAGVHGLRAGDRIDLMAGIPLAKVAEFDASNSRLPGAALLVSAESKNQKQTVSRTIAHDAVVVTPVFTRLDTTTSATLTQGKRIQSVPIQEVVIAVEAEELSRVSAAMDMNYQLTAVAHSSQPGAAEEEARGPETVAVPTLVRDVAAYQQLSEADFRDPNTRRIQYATVPLVEVNRRGIVPNVTDLIGRVLRAAALQGSTISEDDLLPPGTPPGVTGGIPEDRQAISLEATSLHGAETLKIGDRLDVLGAFSLESEVETKATEKLDDGTLRVVESSSLTYKKTSLTSENSLGDRAEHWVLAVDAEVIVPVGTPPAPLAAAALDENFPSRLVIAVDKRDVPALTQAMATEEIVFTAALRSSRDTDQAVAGMVAVPTAPQAIAAYVTLIPEELQDKRNRRETFIYKTPAEVAELGIITDGEQLIGRVLKREKLTGQYFTEDDLLPPWVKTGITASIPPRRRAVVIQLIEEHEEEQTVRSQFSEKTTKTKYERLRIKGLELVKAGTRIDLVAARNLDFGDSIRVHSITATLTGRRQVKAIVRDAIVLQRTDDQAVIAVRPEEVGILEEAITTRTPVRAILYSGQTQDDEADLLTRGYDPRDEASLVETRIGRNRDIFVFDAHRVSRESESE